MDKPSTSVTPRPNGLKRRADDSSDPSRSRPRRSETQTLDRIWKELDANQKERDNVRAAQRREAAKLAAQNPALPPNLRQEPKMALTAENIAQHYHSDETARAFIRRETIVDRVLGYKMLLGRVESYTTMGYVKVDPSVERVKLPSNDLQAEEAALGVSTIKKGPKTPPIDDDWSEARFPPPPQPVEMKKEVTPPPPPPPPKQKGPKTPPGSPGPPPESQVDRNMLLAQIASMTGTPTAQVEAVLGNDLKTAMTTTGGAHILETLKKALTNCQQPVESARKNISSRLSNSLSEKMELVSDTSLSANGNLDTTINTFLPPPPLPTLPSVVLAAPPVPPYLPPLPPPIPLVQDVSRPPPTLMPPINTSVPPPIMLKGPPPPPPPMAPLTTSAPPQTHFSQPPPPTGPPPPLVTFTNGPPPPSTLGYQRPQPLPNVQTTLFSALGFNRSMGPPPPPHGPPPPSTPLMGGPPPPPSSMIGGQPPPHRPTTGPVPLMSVRTVHFPSRDQQQPPPPRRGRGGGRFRRT